MEKYEYKITKDKRFIGQRYSTYTIEKKIIYDNGEIEYRTITWIPSRDGDITKVDFDKLNFQRGITQEEWELLSPEYRKAWNNGTMTKELYQEQQELSKTMDEYVKLLREYLGDNRSYTKTMFKVAATIYRGVKNNRFTFEEALAILNKKEAI